MHPHPYLTPNIIIFPLNYLFAILLVFFCPHFFLSISDQFGKPNMAKATPKKGRSASRGRPPKAAATAAAKTPIKTPTKAVDMDFEEGNQVMAR
jgi:hypothetical protein